MAARDRHIAIAGAKYGGSSVIVMYEIAVHVPLRTGFVVEECTVPDIVKRPTACC
eukprot:COSAG01_NODE_48344_length_382_cov_0.731449_1_plen_54_part_01